MGRAAPASIFDGLEQHVAHLSDRRRRRCGQRVVVGVAGRGSRVHRLHALVAARGGRGHEPLRPGRHGRRRRAHRGRLPLVLRPARVSAMPGDPAADPTTQPSAPADFGALTAITEAVAAGAGLPEVVRAAARALDASMILLDHTSAVLAVAARSTADERSLMANGQGVETQELRVGGQVVGRLRMRSRSEPPGAFLTMVLTLMASEVERLRAPERQSAEAQSGFVRAILDRSVTDRGDIIARASELGLDISAGGAVVVVRAHHYAATEIDWRGRVLAVAERATRATAPGALVAILDHPASSPAATGLVVLVVPADG